MSKVQHRYWVTKQTVFRKLGRKDDECIVASDAELDAKLELFNSIQDSCLDLQRIIDKYQERLCNLAQEENAMGRFLKEAGKSDKTQAGKMMTAVGKSLSYSGQQRLTLRVPLLRLYQEVDTFRHRAIEDTLKNVHGMEKTRTEYRASLNWMKNISQELDPDSYKELEGFRKVQEQVRQSKARFDRAKLDCLQKVDLLAASRCNMFSHALILYQNSVFQFAEKTSNTFTTIANSSKGYQHYDFCVVKELAEPANKLAVQQDQQPKENEKMLTEADKDKLLFFDAEYKDSESETDNSAKKSEAKSTTQNLEAESEHQMQVKNLQISDELLDLSLETSPTQATTGFTTTKNTMSITSSTGEKPVTAEMDLLTSSVDDFSLLNDILNSAEAPAQTSGYGPQWDAVFGSQSSNAGEMTNTITQWDTVFGTEGVSSNGDQGMIAQDVTSSFFPSQLLNQFPTLHTPSNEKPKSSDPASLSASTQLQQQKSSSVPQSSASKPPQISKDKDKRAAWFDLFADLDPLADPDAVGRIGPSVEDRKC